jgi:hypothetical protein
MAEYVLWVRQLLLAACVPQENMDSEIKHAPIVQWANSHLKLERLLVLTVTFIIMQVPLALQHVRNVHLSQEQQSLEQLRSTRVRHKRAPVLT